MRRLLLLTTLLLLAFAAPPVSAQDAPVPSTPGPAMPFPGEPLVWETVGLPLDAFDLWPDASDVFVTDTAAYVNGGEGLFVLRPPGFPDGRFSDGGPLDDEPWTLLIRNILRSGVYATSRGLLFAISDALSRSTDGGHTWQGALDDVRDVVALPSGVLVASEDACCGIGRSTDDGATWTLVDLFDAVVPWGVGYAPPSPRRTEGVAIVVGRNGAMYSRDEGVTWQRSNLVTAFGYNGFHVTYSPARDALFAGINGAPGPSAPPDYPDTGLIWASVDGATWELRGRIATGGDGSPVQIAAGAEGALWAIVPGDIGGVVYGSGDGGRTWYDRGAVEGEPLVGNDVRVNRVRVGPTGRLWLAVSRGEATLEATGAVLRTVAPVTVASEEPVPEKRGAELSAWPNPSDGTVKVSLSLTQAATVRVAVYDVLGREVAVLHDGPLTAGRHPLTLDGSRLPVGLYVMRAESERFAATRRITVLR